MSESGEEPVQEAPLSNRDKEMMRGKPRKDPHEGDYDLEASLKEGDELVDRLLQKANDELASLIDSPDIGGEDDADNDQRKLGRKKTSEKKIKVTEADRPSEPLDELPPVEISHTQNALAEVIPNWGSTPEDIQLSVEEGEADRVFSDVKTIIEAEIADLKARSKKFLDDPKIKELAKSYDPQIISQQLEPFIRAREGAIVMLESYISNSPIDRIPDLAEGLTMPAEEALDIWLREDCLDKYEAILEVLTEKKDSTQDSSEREKIDDLIRMTELVIAFFGAVHDKTFDME